MVRGRPGPSDPGSFYVQYLKSPQWEAKRQVWFAKFGRYCRACGKTSGNIQLHHLDYDRLGHEALSDLIALCADCHREVERLYRQTGRGDRRVATQAYIKRRQNGRRRG